MAFIKHNGGYSSTPLSYRRGNAIPLDESSVWYSYEEMVEYATSPNSKTAYVGQILTLVDEVANTSKVYVILNTAGDLKELGGISGENNNNVVNLYGDDNSIVINNNIVALKNWGTQYYKYVPADGDENPSHYELQIVDEDHPWKIGLTPQVTLEDNEMVLAWYEPNPTILEDLDAVVSSLQTEVTNLSTDIKNLVDEIGAPAADGTVATGIYAEIDNKIEQALININHLSRKIVTSYEDIESYIVANSDADQYIFMVPNGLSDYDNKYQEYLVVDGIIEPVGDWSVELDDYVKKDDLIFTSVDINQFIINDDKELGLSPTFISTFTSGLDELNETVTILETNVGVLGESINEIQNDVSGLSAVISTLQVDVNTIEESVALLQGSVGSLDERLTSIASDVAMNTANLISVDSKLIEIQEILDNLDNNYVTIEDFNKVVGDIDSLLLNDQTIVEQITDIKNQLIWHEL